MRGDDRSDIKPELLIMAKNRDGLVDESMIDLYEKVAAYRNDRILSLKGKYSGRIWMIGNGPSLANTPLHLLKNEYSFGMNAISLIYPATTWRPSFYLCISSNMRFPERRPIFQASIDLGIPSFVRDIFEGVYLESRPNTYWIYTPSVRAERKDELIPGWSTICEYVVWRYATSMYVAAQLAVYMGFAELYLLGCDLGWQVLHDNQNDPNHFAKDYAQHTRTNNQEKTDRINREMAASHSLLKEMSEKYGFNVFNATLGGGLEAHPRVNMLEVLGK